jgi:YesN/AraC family two-component response regulator
VYRKINKAFKNLLYITFLIYCGTSNALAISSGNVLLESKCSINITAFLKAGVQNPIKFISLKKSEPQKSSFPVVKKNSKIVTLVVQKISKILPFRSAIIRIKTHFFKVAFFIISIVVIWMTISFFRNKADKVRFMTTTRLSVMDKEVQRACRHIELNYAEPQLSIDTICNALVTGRPFLEALFQKELGISIQEFINQVRVNRAKIIMGKNPSITVDDLSSMIGFVDGRTFSDVFKSLSGIDLAAYQQAAFSNLNEI